MGKCLSHMIVWNHVCFSAAVWSAVTVCVCFTSVPCFCRRAIRAAFRNCGRGAVLTTHYMEEAEAVCDRVAIVVSGQLRSALKTASHGFLNAGSAD